MTPDRDPYLAFLEALGDTPVSDDDPTLVMQVPLPAMDMLDDDAPTLVTALDG
jgi:hypothetical protein